MSEQSDAPEFTASPLRRRQIREDFPPTVVGADILRTMDQETQRVVRERRKGALLDIVKKELAKDGRTLEDAGPIAIAFPQRIENQDAGTFGHAFAMRAMAEKLRADLIEAQTAEQRDEWQKKIARERAEQTWQIADDIYQTRRVNKGESIGSPITDQQHFASATAFMPGDRRRYFIVFDDISDSGSTLAGLVSYIETHGGKVLAASVGQEKMKPHMRLAADPEWIRKSKGDAAADAAVKGATGKTAGFATEEETLWYRAARALARSGLDIRHLTEGERALLRRDYPPHKFSLHESVVERLEMNVPNDVSRLLEAGHRDSGGFLSDQDRKTLKSQAGETARHRQSDKS